MLRVCQGPSTRLFKYAPDGPQQRRRGHASNERCLDFCFFWGGGGSTADTQRDGRDRRGDVAKVECQSLLAAAMPEDGEAMRTRAARRIQSVGDGSREIRKRFVANESQQGRAPRTESAGV